MRAERSGSRSRTREGGRGAGVVGGNKYIGLLSAHRVALFFLLRIKDFICNGFLLSLRYSIFYSSKVYCGEQQQRQRQQQTYVCTKPSSETMRCRLLSSAIRLSAAYSRRARSSADDPMCSGGTEYAALSPPSPSWRDDATCFFARRNAAVPYSGGGGW